jgi:myo-inositol-1(or 4)-monophosphatase
MAANPRIYAQLVGTLGKYSKFAGAGDKANVRQALRAEAQADADANDDLGAANADSPVVAPAAKKTLTGRKTRGVAPSETAAAAPAATPAPDSEDAPF